MSKKLLLHTCCAPCLSGCLHQLPQECTLTSYFFNPNISLEDEYALRQTELQRFASFKTIHYIIDSSGREEWMERIRPLRHCGERSARCELCYRIRLEQTCIFARDNNYDIFGTTLTLSPHKMTDIINSIGEELAHTYGVRYLVSDFKKRDGVRLSVEESRKFALYRQNYCGCVYSRKEREGETLWNR